MSLLKFQGVGIRGMAAAVPSDTIINEEYTEFFPEADVKEIVAKTGIKQRRFAPEGMTASDLCYAAADKLLNDMEVDRSTIDALIFISQTPDYRMPATGVLLQDRLGLPKSTAAFDMNLGCSAFVYGLSIGFSFLNQMGFQKVLVLDGETRSRVYHKKDRQVAFLFGDGGVAALLEKDEKYGDSFFSLNSDGSRESLIKIDAGGYRNPSSPETVKEQVVDDNGNIRTQEHAYMNGADVFNFVLREIPGDLKKLMEFAGQDLLQFDHYVFHQANNYMNSYLAKKLKLVPEKVPTCLEEFGNTSSVSIPLTIVSRLSEPLLERKQVLLSGFGVGMSWASASLTFDNCFIPSIIEI